ncbi:MAG: hypothetical protein Q9223_002165 [Gallowayella weberi]
MWKSKRNVTITYTLLPPSPSTSTPPLDDRVRYQTLTSSKTKTIEGVDTPSAGARGEEWDWRGKKWLKVATSHWEVLGWGDLLDEFHNDGKEDRENQWAVTFFAKTLFTPAGIDVYSRRKGGVGEEVVERIKEELVASGDQVIRKLAGEIFEVVRD